MTIGGELCEGTSGSTKALYNPATGEEIAKINLASEVDVDRAVKAAKKALHSASWRDMLPAERERILHKFADLMEEHADELARLETLNQGMLLGVSRGTNVADSIRWMRYMAGWATKIHGDSIDISATQPGIKYQVIVRRQPVGVVGAIAPWNFPLMIAIWKIAPALACGCTVVLKPASETPLTALRLGELALEAGMPEGVLNVIVGSGGVAGNALVRHPDIDKITFTGSTEVGIGIGMECARAVKRVALEMGGKSPVVVLDDCDPEVAAKGAAMAIFANQGQVCVAGSRLYVQKKIFDKVVAEIGNIARNYVIGPGFDPASEIGPLVSKQHRDNVLKYIGTGCPEGAELVAGGEAVAGNGFFVKPTVFANTTGRALTLTREEVFGPVLIAQPFDDIEEVVHEANDTVYGLAASVWTNNLSKALRLAERIEAGTVWINGHLTVDPNMPFGGSKQSGIGREHGHAAIDSYTEMKSICIAY
jgi:phenylacetaldehyde dehydrogenase